MNNVARLVGLLLISYISPVHAQFGGGGGPAVAWEITHRCQFEPQKTMKAHHWTSNQGEAGQNAIIWTVGPTMNCPGGLVELIANGAVQARAWNGARTEGMVYALAVEVHLLKQRNAELADDVKKAQKAQADNLLAVAKLPPALWEDPEFIKRFEREISKRTPPAAAPVVAPVAAPAASGTEPMQTKSL